MAEARTFQLRPAQVAAWRGVAIDGFVARACEELRARTPAPFEADDELPEIVAAEVERALGYGLRSPRALMRFLALGLTYGAGFERQPSHGWMRSMLEDPRVSQPDQRMASLIDECIRRRRLARDNEHKRAAFRRAVGGGGGESPPTHALPPPFSLLEDEE